MTSHGEWFRDTKDLKTPWFVETGDDTTHPITQIGKVPLSMQDGQTKYLKDVLHVLTITKNLVSVGQMVEQGLQVTFNPNGCEHALGEFHVIHTWKWSWRHWNLAQANWPC
jgi:hypothetical protein